MFKHSERPIPNSLWVILFPCLSIETFPVSLDKDKHKRVETLAKCLFVLIFRYHLVYKCSYCGPFSSVQLLATCGYLRIIEQSFMMRLIIHRQQLKKIFLSVWSSDWRTSLQVSYTFSSFSFAAMAD